MSQMFLVTTDLSSAGVAVDFTIDKLADVPSVILVEWLPTDRLEPLTRALARVVVAKASGNIDRHLNALVWALNEACGLVPGMHTP